MNSLQKYPHIIESNACILWIFVMILLFPIIFFVSSGMCSTLNQWKYIKLLPFTCKAIQWVTFDLYSSRFITYAPSFIWGELFL